MTELFEQYIANSLSPEEKAHFEERLQTDAQFASDFELYLTLNDDMVQWQQTAAEREQLKQTLQQIGSVENKGKKVVPLRWYMWRAAVVVFVMLAVWIIWTNQGTANGKDLFAKYAAEETISDSRGGATDSLWATVRNDYYDKKYAQALAGLNRIAASNIDSTGLALVYTAICYMHTGNDSAAERVLLQTPTANSEVKEKAQWFKALLYIKTGRSQECAPLLDAIISLNGAYAQQAKRLRKEL